MVTGMRNIVVFVNDIEKARTFYKETLKLPVANESPFMLELFPGATSTLGIATAMHDAAKPLVGRHTGITLTVSNIDELCKEWEKAGVRFVEPLEKSPWGKMAVIADPDGNQFAIVEG